MLTIFLSIAPIFALIVLGNLLRRGGIPNVEFWNLNDKLVYWVLMPALLFYKTSTINFTMELVGSLATVVLGALFAAIVYSIVTTRQLQISGAASSSILQGASRHNTFIALAIAERMYGGAGLELAALITAFLIPMTNISVTSLMVTMLNRPEGGSIFGVILRDLARNPLLLSVTMGVGYNLSGFGEIPVIHETSRILGGAALPIVLMCVGANIRWQAISTGVLPIFIASIGKLIIYPLVIIILSQLVGLSETETIVALLFGAAPTASASYTLARQMGGDAPLMAAIIAIQTALSFFTLPLTILLVQRLIG